MEEFPIGDRGSGPIAIPSCTAVLVERPLHRKMNFSFLHFSLLFSQKYIVRKKFVKLHIYRGGGRRQGPTAVPHSVTYPRGTVALAFVVGHDGRGLVCFQKFVIFLFELGWR
jgi:hypothetical protein